MIINGNKLIAAKIIDTIKKIQGGDKSNLNQDTDAGK